MTEHAVSDLIDMETLCESADNRAWLLPCQLEAMEELEWN